MEDQTAQPWLPDNAEVALDEQAQTVTVVVRRQQPLSFGSVPPGWTVIVEGSLSRVSAESVGTDARLIVEAGDPSRALRIRAPFKIIELHGTARRWIQVSGDGLLVIVRGNRATIDGDGDGLRLQVHPAGAYTARIGGSAAISEISGRGTCRVTSPLSEGAAIRDYEGLIQLTRRNDGQALRHVVQLLVRAPHAALVIDGGLEQGDIEAKSLSVAGKLFKSRVQVASRCDAAAIEDCSVTVTEPDGTGPAIVAGTFADLPEEVPRLRVDLDSGTASTPSWSHDGSAPTVTRSKLRCHGNGHVIVGPAVDCTVETAGSFWAHGDLTWNNPGAPRGAEEVPSYRIGAVSMWVDGDVRSQALVDFHLDNDCCASSIDHLNSLKVGGLLLAAGLVSHVWDLHAHAVVAQGGLKNLTMSTTILKVTGAVANSNLEVTWQADFQDPTDKDTRIVAAHTVELHSSMEGELTLRGGQPGQPDKPLHAILHGDANTIKIEAPRTHLQVDGVRIKRLQMVGTVLVSTVPGDRGGPLRLEEVALNEGQRRPVLLVTYKNPARIGTIGGTAGMALIAASASSKTMSLGLRSGLAAEIASSRRVILRIESGDGRSQTRHLTLAGPGPFVLHQDIASLTTRPTPTERWWPLPPDGRTPDLPGIEAPPPRGTPFVHVSETCTVASVRGEVSLGDVTGTMVGAHDGDGRKSRPAAVLRGMRPREGVRGGRLVGVDPTRLPTEDIGALRQLNVFSPSAKSLLVYAKGRPEDSVDRHERAQRAQRLAEVVNERAMSGNVRSAAFWAAARTRHRTVDGRMERLFRSAHRAMGYGQRPGPALVTWLLSVLLIAALAGASEPLRAEIDVADDAFRSLGYWCAQVTRVLLLPLTLLRLPELTPEIPGHTYLPAAGNEAQVQLLWASPVLHTLAFLLTGLTLSFFVVALKNYLRSPIER